MTRINRQGRRQWRGKAVVATLVASAAFAGGGQVLFPTPAGAAINLDGCGGSGGFDQVCVNDDPGGGGGTATQAGEIINVNSPPPPLTEPKGEPAGLPTKDNSGPSRGKGGGGKGKGKDKGSKPAPLPPCKDGETDGCDPPAIFCGFFVSNGLGGKNIVKKYWVKDAKECAEQRAKDISEANRRGYCIYLGQVLAITRPRYHAVSRNGLDLADLNNEDFNRQYQSQENSWRDRGCKEFFPRGPGARTAIN
jgi:hypothetical protein